MIKKNYDSESTLKKLQNALNDILSAEEGNILNVNGISPYDIPVNNDSNFSFLMFIFGMILGLVVPLLLCMYVIYI